MSEVDRTRLVAWAAEMRAVHQRLRDASALSREALETGTDPTPARDLLLHCWGFCLALSGHHSAEDTVLFPALARAHPDLADVLRHLRQDHSMIEHLLRGLDAAVQARAPAADLLRHLDGVDAVMESHFGYEERQLLALLESFDLDVEPRDAFGPLA